VTSEKYTRFKTRKILDTQPKPNKYKSEADQCPLKYTNGKKYPH
jgi:hypothetical protein